MDVNARRVRYRDMRTAYFKKAVGPSKVEVVERIMQRLEDQSSRAISFGERRLDSIAAELKAAESAAEGMVDQLRALREELDGEKEHRAELTHENAQVRYDIAIASCCCES